MRAVVLAGGLGTRMSPYTFVLPKPLLPLGGRPIVEHILRRLAAAGFLDVHISLGYLGGLVSSYLTEFAELPEGIDLTFATEKDPLGTAGALRLIPAGTEPLLVTNGDVLTDLDYANLLEYHRRTRAMLTIATQHRETALDFGIVDLGEGGEVIRFAEKPIQHHDVNMGIYVYEPAALAWVARSERMDVPTLVEQLLEAGQRVVAYQYTGAWYDVGSRAEFERAAREFNGDGLS